MSEFRLKKSLPRRQAGPPEWVSMQEASKLVPYSQEYLSLLARRDKIFAKKIGRNWYTSKEALEKYVAEQSILAINSRLIQPLQKPQVFLAEAPVQESSQTSRNLIDEFKRLNPQIFKTRETPAAAPTPQPAPEQTIPNQDTVSAGDSVLPPQPEPEKISEIKNTAVLERLDKLSNSLETFAEKVTNSSAGPRYDIPPRIKAGSPRRLMAAVIAAIVVIFVLVGGFSFGQADAVVQRIQKFFSDATTLDGPFAGTHANEVLVLDKAGNISIYGHIETEGQLRSRAPDGVAPIVVDSVTKVENLNADFFDSLDSKEFTLAFVTKNGNVTYEDVFLEGNVEVGKTLTVKGAAKLLDSLAVYGKDVTLTNGSVNIEKGNLIIGKGTIKITSTELIKNLNAEYLDGIKKGQINLDFVVGNGNETSKTIKIGGLEVRGAPGFFYDGVWGETGSFQSLGVGGDAVIGDNSRRDKINIEIYSKNFSLNSDGNVGISGSLTAGSVMSDLTPSGSYNLGSASKRWQNVYSVNGLFSGDVTVSGSFSLYGAGNLSGTTSSSFAINSDNTSADAEDAYLSFERGTITPNATIKWNSSANLFEINEPLRISSSSFTAWGDIVLGSASSNTLTVNTSTLSIPNNLNIDSGTLYIDASANRIGLGTASPTTVLEVQGTSSASYGLFGTLQVGGFSSASYNRFGTNSTTHTNYITASNDLLVSGDLEVDATASFDSFVQIGNLLSFSGTDHAGLKLNNLTTAQRDTITAQAGMTLGSSEIVEVTSGTAGSVLF